MVKSAEARAAKAQAKVDPTVISARITAMQDVMKSNAATAQADAYTVASNVRGILNTYSVTGNFANTFQAFANELAAKQRKYTDAAYIAEAGLVLAKWKLRCTIGGSIPPTFVDILTAICNLYGVTYA